MLNPKIVDVYGNKCLKFFNRLIGCTDEKVLDMCYVIVGGTINSGELCGPELISVDTLNEDVIRDFERKCMHISLELKRGKEECSVLCLPYDRTFMEKDGVKLWV